MAQREGPKHISYAGPIEVYLRDISQLFNTMDPSPFHEKDLDNDAEEFIISWAREIPPHELKKLIVHLDQVLPEADAAAVGESVRHYFRYRYDLNQREFRHLLKDGRKSLAIGLGFLGICLLLSEAISLLGLGAIATVFRESLTIGGWVAMWRPMEIYLYEWWPLKRLGKVYWKLSGIEVEIRKKE